MFLFRHVCRAAIVGVTATLAAVTMAGPPPELSAAASVDPEVALRGVSVPTSGSAAVEPGPPPAGWVVVTDHPSGVSVALPAAAETKEENRDGTLVRSYAARQPAGGIALVVSGAASDSVDPALKQAFLDGTLDGAKESWGAGSHITERQHLTVGKYSAIDGRIVGVVNDQEAFFVVRSVVVGNHLVAVVTSGLRSDENNLTDLHRKALTTLQLPTAPDELEDYRATVRSFGRLAGEIAVYLGLAALAIFLLVRWQKRHRARPGTPPPPGPHPGYQALPYQPGPYQPNPYQQGHYPPGPHDQGPYQQNPYQAGRKQQDQP